MLLQNINEIQQFFFFKTFSAPQILKILLFKFFLPRISKQKKIQKM